MSELTIWGSRSNPLLSNEANTGHRDFIPKKKPSTGERQVIREGLRKRFRNNPYSRNPARAPQQAETSFNLDDEIRTDLVDNRGDVRIDIPESEPLVPTPPNPGGGISSGVLPIAGAAGTIIGGVLGGILHKRTQEKGLVLPDSEYIGPGNEIPISAAKDEAEQIAKDHDAGYRDLTYTPEEFGRKVALLDRAAIDAFRRVTRQGVAWKARIGQIGLTIKRKVEEALGEPLYPFKKSKYFYIILTYLLFSCRYAKSFGKTSLREE